MLGSRLKKDFLPFSAAASRKALPLETGQGVASAVPGFLFGWPSRAMVSFRPLRCHGGWQLQGLAPSASRGPAIDWQTPRRTPGLCSPLRMD